MGRPPQRSKPHVLNYLQVRLDGSLKNEVIAHCKRLNCSVNAWLVEVIKSALRAQKGLPEPPQARTPLPSPADQIRAYAAGERIMMPCGKQDTCAAIEKEHTIHDGLHFCRECGIRVL